MVPFAICMCITGCLFSIRFREAPLAPLEAQGHRPTLELGLMEEGDGQPVSMRDPVSCGMCRVV